MYVCMFICLIVCVPCAQVITGQLFVHISVCMCVYFVCMSMCTMCTGDNWAVVCSSGKQWRRDDKIRLKHVVSD